MPPHPHQPPAIVPARRPGMISQAKGEALAVYSILDRGEDQRPYWLRIGTCFRNRDGSQNIYLDALPRDGKLQVRSMPAQENGAVR